MEVNLDSLKAVGEAWGATSALAVAIVYLAGYLVTRSHMSAWGIHAGGASLDLRHLFAGGSFLVFAFLHLTWLGFALLLLAGVAAAADAIAPFDIDAAALHRQRVWIAPPAAGAGLVFFFAFSAQATRLRNLFLMTPNDRRALFASNPAMVLFERVLADRGPARNLHGRLLFAAAAATTAVAVWPGGAASSALVEIGLAIAVAAQILALPLHYGIFYFERSLPRLEATKDAPEQVLLHQDNERAALLTAEPDGAFSMSDAPRAALDGRRQIGIVALGDLLFKGTSPCSGNTSAAPPSG